MPSREKADNSNLGYFLLANPRIISPTRAKEPNIVLISIDTLRRDHLSTYGYEKKTSPFLDSLASESAVFNNAIAQAPYTVTSHITMMTSLWPSAHQILTHDHQDRLSTKWLTLPQILKARGYQTAGFTGGGQVSAVYGFDRGMDVYDFEGGRSEVIFPKANEWIIKTQGNPFFLFLHTYDVHMPYEPPPPFDNIFDPEYKGTINRWNEGCIEIIDPELFSRILDLYDGEIRYVDAQIQRVVQFLREKGLYKNTVLIVTSDHGEEFMEHGSMACHAHTLYNELLLIPLIIKFPNGQWAGRIIPDPVALNDLMPTVLDYMDILFPSHSQGKTLLDYLEDNVTRDVPRPIFSEQIVIRDDPRVEVSIQTLSEKYYQRLNLPGEYFLLVNDSGEQHNLLESQKKKASMLEKSIREYMSANKKLAKLGSETKGSRSQEMDEKTVEKLKALGYIK
ncbi:MAG: sulfatase [Candidatus Aminicenantaceae bacterium]